MDFNNSKEKVDPNNNDEEYHDFDITESINSLLLEGTKSYREKKYIEALDQFTHAKELDANHGDPDKRKKFVHHCDYKSGLVYNQLDKKEIEPVKKNNIMKQLHIALKKHEQTFRKIYLGGKI